MNQLSLFTKTEVENIDIAKVFANEQEMRERVPALFATTPHPRMSERYAFTNTYDIVASVHSKGWSVSSIMGGRKKYSKLIVRCRHQAYTYGDNAPELIIIDSHDGTSRLKLALGVIRFLCMNGMIAGDISFARSYMHYDDDLMAQVWLDVQDVDPHVRELEQRVTAMKEFQTTFGQRLALAQTVAEQRFGEDKPAHFIAEMRQKLLHTRRNEDKRDDLYTVVNVLQENALRGGLAYETSNGAVRRMSEITNVDRNIHINNRIWNAAAELMKAAA